MKSRSVTAAPDTVGRFSGTNQYVRFGGLNDTFVFEYTDDFKFSSWIKPNVDPASKIQVLFSKQTQSGNYRGIQVHLNGGTMYFRIRNNNPNFMMISLAAPFKLNRWNHWECHYDGSGAAAGMGIKIDGVPQAVTVDSDNLNSLTVQDTSTYAYTGTAQNGLYDLDADVYDYRVISASYGSNVYLPMSDDFLDANGQITCHPTGPPTIVTRTRGG